MQYLKSPVQQLLMFRGYESRGRSAVTPRSSLFYGDVVFMAIKPSQLGFNITPDIMQFLGFLEDAGIGMNDDDTIVVLGSRDSARNSLLVNTIKDVMTMMISTSSCAAQDRMTVDLIETSMGVDYVLNIMILRKEKVNKGKILANRDVLAAFSVIQQLINTTREGSVILGRRDM